MQANSSHNCERSTARKLLRENLQKWKQGIIIKQKHEGGSLGSKKKAIFSHEVKGVRGQKGNGNEKKTQNRSYIHKQPAYNVNRIIYNTVQPSPSQMSGASRESRGAKPSGTNVSRNCKLEQTLFNPIFKPQSPQIVHRWSPRLIIDLLNSPHEILRLPRQIKRQRGKSSPKLFIGWPIHGFSFLAHRRHLVTTP